MLSSKHKSGMVYTVQKAFITRTQAVLSPLCSKEKRGKKELLPKRRKQKEKEESSERRRKMQPSPPEKGEREKFLSDKECLITDEKERVA